MTFCQGNYLGSLFFSHIYAAIICLAGAHPSYRSIDYSLSLIDKIIINHILDMYRENYSLRHFMEEHLCFSFIIRNIFR